LESVATVISRLEHGGIGPDFRFRHAAFGRENSDDGPFVLSYANIFSEIQSSKLTRGAGSDDDLVAT
jgi:hypothetical protein